MLARKIRILLVVQFLGEKNCVFNEVCCVLLVFILPDFVLCLWHSGALRDLVVFAQFKKREKHPRRSVNFSKVADTDHYNKINIPCPFCLISKLFILGNIIFNSALHRWILITLGE